MLPLRGFEQIASLAHVKHALILFALQILFKLRGIWWHSTYGRMLLDWEASERRGSAGRGRANASEFKLLILGFRYKYAQWHRPFQTKKHIRIEI